MRIPFIGPTYPLESAPASVQDTVNLRPVPIEPGNERTAWVFQDVPGLVRAVAIDDWPGGGIEAWLTFDVEDDTEPIYMTLGSFGAAGDPLPWVDGVSRVSDNGGGSNDSTQIGSGLYVPLFSNSEIPTIQSVTPDVSGYWLPASGNPLTPSITDVDPSSGVWSQANRFVHFAGSSGADFAGWAGGILLLSDGADQLTVITFLPSTSFYPPLSVEYVAG